MGSPSLPRKIMMRYQVVGVVGFLLALLYPTKGYSRYTISVRDGFNLRDVFDSGIRPRVVRGLANSLCEFKAEAVVFALPNGARIEAKNGYGRLHVFDSNDIYIVEYYEDYASGLDEGLERLTQYADILGVPEQKAQILDGVMQFRRSEDHFGDPFGIGKKADALGEWKVSVKVANSHVASKPFRFIIEMGAGALFRGKKWPNRRPVDQPLRAPLGYEHISMEPEPISASDSTVPKILTPAEISKMLGTEIRVKSKTGPQQRQDERISTPSNKLTEEPIAATANPVNGMGKGVSWWVVGCGILFVTATAAWLVRFTKKSRRKRV